MRPYRHFWLLAPLLAALLCPPPAAATVHEYVEDFTTTQYCDTLNTTAFWDTATGEVRLFSHVPTLAGGCATSGSAFGVAIAGDYAYVADQLPGFQVLDISDPTNPVSVGSCETPGYSVHVVVAGDYAYVADQLFGLRVDVPDDPDSSAAGAPGHLVRIDEDIRSDLTLVAI